MRKNWTLIDRFPNYAICDDGDVINNNTNEKLRQVRNQQGICVVKLFENGHPHSRSVTKLVADHFLEPHVNPLFSTPIQLDGVRSNNHVSNMMWRPRWFAIKYHQQFGDDAFWSSAFDFIDDATEEIFHSPKECAMKYGLYYRDIIRSTNQGRHVFPTGQIFSRLPESY